MAHGGCYGPVMENQRPWLTRHRLVPSPGVVVWPLRPWQCHRRVSRPRRIAIAACPLVILTHLALALHNRRERHWRWPQRTASRTGDRVNTACDSWGREQLAFDPSQTASECFPYCSTIGKMSAVTMRCARLKLWSISASVSHGGGAHGGCADLAT